MQQRQFLKAKGVIIVIHVIGGGTAEWLRRCASISKIASSNPSGGSELTFRSDLLLTARGGTVRERSLSLPVCRVTRVTHSAFSA
jgi:hypothetical protein